MYGFLLGVLASFMLACSATCVRAMNHAIPDIEVFLKVHIYTKFSLPLILCQNKAIYIHFLQLNGLRFLTVFLVTLPCFLYKKEIPRIESKCSIWGWVIVWSGTGILTTTFHFTSLAFIGLGKVISIQR